MPDQALEIQYKYLDGIGGFWYALKSGGHWMGQPVVQGIVGHSADKRT